MRIVQISYTDSSQTYEQTDEIAKPVTIQIVGWVVLEAPGYIVLASEVIHPNEYRGQTAIPKSAILSQHTIQDRRGLNDE